MYLLNATIYGGKNDEEIFQKTIAGHSAGADHDGQSGACRDGGGRLHFEWSGAYIWQLVCHHKANLY
nr:hypothetical protein [uncultured Oscillibacter sp.]